MRLAVDKITDISAAYVVALSADELNRQMTELQQKSSGTFVGDIRIDFTLSRVERRLLLTGDFHSDLDLQCGRCLKDFSGHIHETFSLALNLMDKVEEESREEFELDEEQINSVVLESGEIDLLPIIQEQVLMQLPSYPSCDENCAGLCPHCGGNLNITECHCEPRPFNNRFGQLKNIKLDQS